MMRRKYSVLAVVLSLLMVSNAFAARYKPPTIANLAASDVTDTSARLNGLVEKSGGDNPSCSIYWGTSDGGTDPANWDHVESCGVYAQTATFFADVAGLQPNTVYYYRCHGVNVAGDGWAGTTASLTTTGGGPTAPSVMNHSASDITQTSARLNGEVTSTGGENPTVSIYWGDNDGGTTPASWDNAEDLGAKGAETFFKDASSLLPETAYYYRSYAVNSAGSDWADSSETFTTLPDGGPSDNYAYGEIAGTGTRVGTYVDTHASDDVYHSIEEHESGGKPSSRYSFMDHRWLINVSGGSTVTLYLEAHHTANSEGDDFIFSYSTNDVNYTDAITVTKTADNDTAQVYELPSDLSGTVYIQCLDADRTAGRKQLDTIYVDELFIRCTTQVTPPAVVNLPASNVSQTDARLNGDVTSTGGEDPTVYVYWGDDDAGTLAANWDNEVNLGTKAAGQFHTDVADLLPETAYYYRCYAVNSAGESWAASAESFTTLGVPMVGQYEKLEHTFTLGSTYSNPFDPAEVDVTATFTQPDMTQVTIPAFYYMEYDIVSSSPEKYGNGRNPCWKVRFAPAQLGEHTFTITVVDGTGTDVLPGGTFNCVAGTSKGFVGVDARDVRYLSYDDGTAYIPIGHNMAWDEGDGTVFWNDRFAQMGTRDMNWTRIWMTHFYEGHTIEWNKNYHTGYFDGVGSYSLEMAWKLDRMIEAAEANGVAIQLVLQHHGQFSTSVDSNWDENPYNAANADSGGFLSTPQEFFTDAQAKDLMKRKLRYIIARWGYSPSILAWELFNEMQFTEDYRDVPAQRSNVAAWHSEMATYIESIDPFVHLITSSGDLAGSRAEEGLDQIWSLPNIDLVQVHDYGPRKIEAFVSGVERLSSFGKPIIIGEFGQEDGGENDPYALGEPEQTQCLDGLMLHNGMWSATHLGSSAMYWWWYNYLYERDMVLLGHHEALADYWAGEDPAACGLASADVTLSGGPVNSGLFITPGLGDFYDVSTQTNFDVQADGTVPGIENLSIWLHGSWKPETRSDPTFSIDLGSAGDLKIHVTDVAASGVNSLRVLVDGGEVFSSSYPNGQQNFTIDVPLSAGQQSVRIENTGEDWFLLAGYEFTGFDVPATRVVGQAGTDHAYLWFYDIGSQYHMTDNGVISGVQATVNGLADGSYVVETWDTRAPGGVAGSTTGTAAGSALTFTVLDFARDCAVKIRPQ